MGRNTVMGRNTLTSRNTKTKATAGAGSWAANPHTLRVLLLLAAALALGPAPGEAGGCGSEVLTANPVQYCFDRYAYECERLDLRGDFPTAGFDSYEACIQYALDQCPNRISWPLACEPKPSTYEVDACLWELSLVENVDTPIEEIAACDVPECRR